MSSRISKRKPKSSTVRRATLATFIESFGDEMPTKCSPCKAAGRVCRVHVRSGRCGACNRTNDLSCDISVTASEFQRLLRERKTLNDKLLANRQELEAARSALDVAHERYATALAKESRLVKQLDQTAKRASEAIAVEERGIQEAETSEFLEELDLPSFESLPFDDRLLLSPRGWEQLFPTPSAGVSDPPDDGSATRALLS
jgi:hypothetical protein